MEAEPRCSSCPHSEGLFCTKEPITGRPVPLRLNDILQGTPDWCPIKVESQLRESARRIASILVDAIRGGA